jgi:hemerythrin
LGRFQGNALQKQKNKVLIVDGDAGVIIRLTVALGTEFSVVSANDPGRTLALARQEKPDLILCDVAMPGVDSYELCRRLKSDPETGAPPIIMLTARPPEAADRQRGLDAGAVDCLNKSSEPNPFKARLRLHLQLRQAEAQKDQTALLESKVAERTAQLEASLDALRASMHNLRTTPVATGVFWVQVPEAGLYILCGSPGDVVKHLMLRGHIAEEDKGEVKCETGPNVILLSDVLVQNGNFANLSEFPVLQMLYRQGLILPGHPNNTGTKPMIIGSESQVRAQLNYIYRGNYGLVSEEEMTASGVDAAEARRLMALKLRFAFGEIKKSEDLLDYRIIGEGPADLGQGVSVRRVSLNKFEFSYRGRTTLVDLNLAPGQSYDSPYTPGQHLIEPEFFGVIHCGEGDGWDLRRQSMASIVMLQGRYYLVDAGPSVLHTLGSVGIDLSEIEGIFHTHAHDDHFAGLPALLASGRRIKYFATPMVRASVTKKLSALMSLDEGLFAELFEVRDLRAGEWNECEGMEVLPVHTPHPVENTMFTFRVRDGDKVKSYSHWADVASMQVLRRLVAEANSAVPGVLPADYADTVRERYLAPATLKKIDAGGGLIHGEPGDFAGDKSDKLVLAHRAAPFTREELDVGSQATFGAVDVLVPGTQDYLLQRAFGELVQLFPEATLDELKALLSARVTACNTGDIILKRGTAVKQVFLLISGSAQRERAGLDTTFDLACGTLIGVEALFQAEALADTWRTTSPVRLLPIDIGVLRDFLGKDKRGQALQAQLADAAFLRNTWLFGERLTLGQQSTLARAARAISLPANQAAPNVLCLVRAGRAALANARGKVFEVVGPGGFFGEESCLSRPAAWRTVAMETCEVVAVNRAALRGIPVALWKMLEIHERRMRTLELTQRG